MIYRLNKQILAQGMYTADELLIAAYLAINADSTTGDLDTCIQWMLEDLGKTPKSGIRGSNANARNALAVLEETGAIEIDGDPRNRITTRLRIHLSESHPLYKPSGDSLRVTQDDFDSIVSLNYQRVSQAFVARLVGKLPGGERTEISNLYKLSNRLMKDIC